MMPPRDARVLGAGAFMHRKSIAVVCAGLFTACLAGERASAEIVVSINKATQNMLVLVGGVERHRWAVSTGLGGGPPSGTYRPQRFERKWWSHKYHRAPMPYSIFFHEGYAIHGTIHVSRLGHRASKGCVRLHPKDAAVLFDLVRGSAGQTRIVISGTTHVAVNAPPAAKIEAPKSEALKIEAPTAEAPKSEAPKFETPRVEASAQPRGPGAPIVATPPQAAADVTGQISTPAKEGPGYEE